MSPSIPACWRSVLVMGLAACAATAGCFSAAPSQGGGQTTPPATRPVNPADIALPPGYVIEVVATGLTFPTGVTFDDAGRIYVIEAGYSYGEVFTTPKLLRVEPGGRTSEVAAGKNGPWTGIAWAGGAFIIAEGGELEGGRIIRMTPDGKSTT